MQRAKYGEILWNYRIHDISLHDCQMDLIVAQGAYTGEKIQQNINAKWLFNVFVHFRFCFGGKVLNKFQVCFTPLFNLFFIQKPTLFSKIKCDTLKNKAI
jgi:hypothetical protein